jgi:hypothetical protein
VQVTLENTKAVTFSNPNSFTISRHIAEYDGNVPDAMQSLPEEIIVKFKK